jgi:hypothetical protein
MNLGVSVRKMMPMMQPCGEISWMRREEEGERTPAGMIWMAKGILH